MEPTTGKLQKLLSPQYVMKEYCWRKNDLEATLDFMYSFPKIYGMENLSLWHGGMS